MDRIFDSPELFDCGVGRSTTARIKCDWCDETYEDKTDTVSTLLTDFADKQICECCFGKIENEILRRMPTILKWYRKIINMRKAKLRERDRLLKKVEGGLTHE